MVGLNERLSMEEEGLGDGIPVGGVEKLVVGLDDGPSVGGNEWLLDWMVVGSDDTGEHDGLQDGISFANRVVFVDGIEEIIEVGEYEDDGVAIGLNDGAIGGLDDGFVDGKYERLADGLAVGLDDGSEIDKYEGLADGVFTRLDDGFDVGE